MSLPQLRAAIATQAGLMQSKINALQSRWHTAMGDQVPDFPIVQPHSQQALDAIASRSAPPSAQGGAAPAKLAPPRIGEI